MYPSIKKYCDNLINAFETIPNERKENLEKISNYIQNKISQNKTAALIFICTHNSRRSHFGQIWTQTACGYYNLKNITTILY